MRKLKVMTYYGDKNDYELSTLAGTVLTSMTVAADVFTAPRPTLEEYGSLVDDFVAKHELVSRGGSTLENQQKKVAKAALLEAMGILAQYVNSVAKGNGAILVSSGFELAANPRTLLAPDLVSGVRLQNGRQLGQLRLDFDALKAAYEYEYALAHTLDEVGQPVWDATYNTSTSRGNVIGNVVSGDIYYVRVRARNYRGWSDWSAVSTVRAL
ncbi:hypothetical protein SAMN05216436_11988 [bacterium A37T11]|nr:hypothetical protein SAMN05216436_11988 [bacterium A37T11]